MNEMSKVKKSAACAICIALCCVLPLTLHGVQDAAKVLCPMHIPALLCGLVCGWQFGLFCGLAGPALSCLLTSMPAAAYLPSMMIELSVYGAVSGLLMRYVRTGSTYADLYISQISAMLLGRVLSGISKTYIFMSGDYGMEAWIAGSVIESLPGTVIQLILIPTLVFALMRARLIPERYQGTEKHSKHD